MSTNHPRPPRRLRRLLVSSALALVVVPMQWSPAAANIKGPSIARHQVDSKIEVRAGLGFPADPEHVASLLNSKSDVGSRKYGIPLTANELTEFERRMDLLDREFEEMVRARPDFAGLHIDHLSGGKVVVTTTGDATKVAGQLQAAAPRIAKDLVVRHSSITTKELESAAISVFAQRASYFPGMTVHSVGVSVSTMSLTVTVPHSQVAAARQQANNRGQFTASRPLMFVKGGQGPGTETACTSRDNCVNPMKPGIRINNQVVTCTMGFHIRVGTDYQFLTSGHCGYGDTSNIGWYHQGYGLIGNGQATLYTTEGVDIRRVQINNAQTTNDIYGVNGGVTWAGWPVDGRIVCASLGRSHEVQCGTVAEPLTTWTSETCGCTQHGGRYTGIQPIRGDSGSPVWEGSSQDTTKKAIGSVSTTGGHFARVQDALNHWNAVIRTTP